MDVEYLTKILQDFKNNKKDLNEVLGELKKLPYEDLGFARIDHHRALRGGFPEVIFCQGKTVEQVVRIFKSLAECNSNVIATRADVDFFEAVGRTFPRARYHEVAKIISLTVKEIMKTSRKVLIVSAGTADISVAEEAAVTAEIMGHTVQRIYDVGIAGLHRLLIHREDLQSAAVIIVVAGMEGALPGVVGGLVDTPVIAVPTSVGYGANFNGLAALLTMLNSCAGGIGVVNIDNGFGAAVLADSIIRSGLRGQPSEEQYR